MVGIIRKGGLSSLYAGWGAVLCRNVPHSIIKVRKMTLWLMIKILGKKTLGKREGGGGMHWLKLVIRKYMKMKHLHCHFMLGGDEFFTKTLLPKFLLTE